MTKKALTIPDFLYVQNAGVPMRGAVVIRNAAERGYKRRESQH
ncbi:hypothetical protein [Ectobacillus panaciterrae]